MDIRIAGHQVATGDALNTHVQTRLQTIVDKHFKGAISAQVTFGRGPHDNGFTCDIVMNVMRGLVLKGRNDAQDAHPAFDGAAEKIEKQLRRYMRRLKDTHAAETIEVAEAGGYDNARYTLFEEPSAEGGRGRRRPADRRRDARRRARRQRVGCGNDAGSAEHAGAAVQELGHGRAQRVEMRRIERPWSARGTRLPFVRHEAARRRALVSARTLAVGRSIPPDRRPNKDGPVLRRTRFRLVEKRRIELPTFALRTRRSPS